MTRGKKHVSPVHPRERVKLYLQWKNCGKVSPILCGRVCGPSGSCLFKLLPHHVT